MLDQARGTLATMVAQWPLLGLAMTHHRSTRGAPLSFKDMPYLVELYTDLPNVESADIRKAVQTGISELCIQLALERAGWSGRIVAYILPTYSIRDRFVQQRIDPPLQSVPAYAERTPGGDFFAGKGRTKKAAGNLKLKRFGSGAMMFLGSNTPGDFIEFSADTLIVDEYDQCDPQNLSKARDRLRASPYPQQIRLGNPTLPRVGISRLFDEGDGRRWFHRCSHCGERQPLDWFQNVIEQNSDGKWVARDRARARDLSSSHKLTAARHEDIRPICLRCDSPFDRVADGALWVPAHSMRPNRSYTMSRLDVLSDPLWMLLQEWNKAQASPEQLSAFYCSVLGVPYEFSGARVTHAMLGDSARGEALDYNGGSWYKKRVVTAGVDVGTVLNVTISVIEAVEGKEEPARVARLVIGVRTFEEVIDLFKRFHVDVAVVDVAPEMRKAQELRDHFIENGGTVVWLCRFFPTQRVGVQKYGMRLDYQAQIVTVDRTQVFDVTFEDIREGKRVFPEDVFHVLGWSDQMRAPVRVLDEKRGRIIWTEGSAADHYRLTDIYDRIAYDLVEMGGTYTSM